MSVVPLPAPRPDHCHHGQELPAQRSGCGGRERTEEQQSQIKRTFGRRERELRLTDSLPARLTRCPEGLDFCVSKYKLLFVYYCWAKLGRPLRGL